MEQRTIQEKRDAVKAKAGGKEKDKTAVFLEDKAIPSFIT